jgi:hypothetical protein
MSSQSIRSDRRKKAASVNCLSEILRELIDEWKISLADVQRGTGIAWPTLQGYFSGKVKTQMLDGNILALSKFFGCSINYLAFGIGEEPIKPEAPEFDQAALNKAAREKEKTA